MPWEFLMIYNVFLSYKVTRAVFSWALSANLYFWSTHLPKLHEGAVRWRMKFMCWLCSSYPWPLHRTKFLLDWPRLETQKSANSLCMLFVGFVTVLLLCSYKRCFKVLILMHFPFISLWPRQIFCWKDGPFQFPTVQVCTLGPSPYGWCHWLPYCLLQVGITFFKLLEVKINPELCDSKPHFIFWV